MVDFDLENYSFIDLNNFQLSEPPSFFIPDTDSTYTESDLLNEEKDLGVCKVCGRKLRGFDSFIDLIDKGIIEITFKIGMHKFGNKVGKPYDHGTDFSIKVSNLDLLYDKLS